MIVVTFEVEFLKNKKSEYFKLVRYLQKELDKQEGLISVERYLHQRDTNKLLSFQFWDSEKSVLKWKNNLKHTKIQKLGKEKLFKNYKISISKLIRSYTFKKIE